MIVLSMRRWMKFLIIGTLQFACANADASVTQLIVTGHFGEGSRIYNCLAFQRCDRIQTSMKRSMQKRTTLNSGFSCQGRGPCLRVSS